MNKYLLSGVIFLALALLAMGKLYSDMAADRARIALNFEQVQSDNQVLNLKYNEADQLHTSDKAKLDSVLQANKIKPKAVVSATIINTVYIDTGSVKIVYKEPIKQPDSSYIVPVSYSNKCWGMKGNIVSLDSASRLNITERTAQNSAQLIVTRKQFLGFLWYRNKKTKYQAFSDCGEIQFSEINFQK